MDFLVIKEDVRSEDFQYPRFFNAAEQEKLVNIHIHALEGGHHAFMGRSTPSGNDGRL